MDIQIPSIYLNRLKDYFLSLKDGGILENNICFTIPNHDSYAEIGYVLDKHDSTGETYSFCISLGESVMMINHADNKNYPGAIGFLAKNGSRYTTVDFLPEGVRINEKPVVISITAKNPNGTTTLYATERGNIDVINILAPAVHEHAITDVAGLGEWKNSIDLWRGLSSQSIIKCYIAPWGTDDELDKVQLVNQNLTTYKGGSYYASQLPSGPFEKVTITDLHLNYYIITNPGKYERNEYGDGTVTHPFLNINKACRYLSNFRASGSVNFEIIALIRKNADGTLNNTFYTTSYQFLYHPDATGNGSDASRGWLNFRAAYESSPEELIKDGSRAIFDFSWIDSDNFNRWNAFTIGGVTVYIRDIELKCRDYATEYNSVTDNDRRGWWQRSIGINISNDALVHSDNLYITGFCCGIFMQKSTLVVYNNLVITGLPIEKHQSGYNVNFPPFAAYPEYNSDGKIINVDTFYAYSTGISVGLNSLFQTGAYTTGDSRYQAKTVVLIKNFYIAISASNNSRTTSWAPATGIDAGTSMPIFGTPIEIIIADCFMGVAGNNSILKALLPYWVDDRITDDNVEYDNAIEANQVYSSTWLTNFFDTTTPAADAPSPYIKGYEFIKDGINESSQGRISYYVHVKTNMPSRYMYMGLFQKGALIKGTRYDTAVSNCTIVEGAKIPFVNNTTNMFETNVHWSQYFHGVKNIVVLPDESTSYVY